MFKIDHLLFIFRKVNYHARSLTMDDSDEAVMGDLTELEKKILGSQELMRIEGKVFH